VEIFENVFPLLALVAEVVDAGLRAEVLVPAQRRDGRADPAERLVATEAGGHDILLRLWNARSSASSAQNSLQKPWPVVERQNCTRPSTVRNGMLQKAQCFGVAACRLREGIKVTNMTYLQRELRRRSRSDAVKQIRSRPTIRRNTSAACDR
jgi:hypothetical protein